MARYTGPKQKKARSFGSPIFGESKAFNKKNHPPGQHGKNRRRRQASDYKLQLQEKQKAKFTYGLMEKQFRNLFDKASHKHGVTGTVLLQMLESRLDNVVYRMGLAPTRRAARQLVNHRHIVVNGVVTNIPSYHLRPGDVIEVRGKSRNLPVIQDQLGKKTDIAKYKWLEFNPDQMKGIFLEYPEREQIPEELNEQLIVELYSK